MDIVLCTEKFVGMLEKLGASENEIFTPLLSEMTQQLSSDQPPNLSKIKLAIQTVKSTLGYQSRFNDALDFVRDNWGTSPGISKGVGAKFELMMQQQQSIKHHEESIVQREKVKVIQKVSKMGKEERFKKAFSDLKLGQCRAWLRYLRDTKSTGFNKTLQKQQQPWQAAYKKAGELIDPLLTGRKIYDDSQPVEVDPIGASQSEAKEAAMRIVLKHYKLTDITSPTHWYAKGMIIYMNPDITIRCDGSAALAFYLLAIDKDFNSSVGLVQQGEDPRLSGHWFLVAGVKEDLVTEKINVYGARDNLGWLFTVDLWGASFKGVKSTLLYPAGCMVGEWKHKVLWTV